MKNRKKVTISKNKVTFHNHGFISDDESSPKQASDPTQIDHQLGEHINQDYLEEEDNDDEGDQFYAEEGYVPSNDGDDDGQSDVDEEDSYLANDDGHLDDKGTLSGDEGIQLVEALESRKLPEYVTKHDATEIEQMLSLAHTDRKVLKLLKREVFNLASCLVGCYVSEQGPQKSNNRYSAAYV
jgi:hypothetical protein